METNASFVSRCINDLKLNTKDGHISRRFILSIGTTKARFLMSQKLDELSLFREDGIISYLKCFRTKQVKARDCGIFEFRLCENVMKSINKIPKGIFGKAGSGIISVTNVQGDVYHPITPRAFKELFKRKYTRNTSRYYTIEDGYLYLPNSTNELVDITMFSMNKWEVDAVSECGETKQVCKSYWDYEFVCPDRLYESVVSSTLQELGTFYKASVEDENGNLDSNIKSQTTR